MICWEEQARPEQWAKRLMAKVYVPFSALIFLDEAGRILEIAQFDTFFPDDGICIASGAAQIWIFSNHPEGRKEMQAEDWQNLSKVKKAAGQTPIRFFLTGEELGCMEVEI